MSPPPPPTDETLAAGVATGDPGALHALHLRYADRTLRFLRRVTRDPELAEDLTQETFTRVWLRADTFDVAGCRFRGWLFTIALNLARSALARRRSVVGVQREVMEARPSEAESPYARLARTEDERRVAQAVARLAPPLREVVVLRIYRQLSFGEIAGLTCTPEATLRLRFHRAVQRLRQRLNPHPAAAAGRSVSPRYTAAHAAARREHRPRGHRASGPPGA